MKKDIEWLEKELRNLEKLVKEALEASLIAKNEHYTEKNSNELQLLRRVFSLIDQLDEPESVEPEVKSKQKLIEKWESAIEAAEFYGKGKEDRLIEYMRDFVSDLSQLDDPEVLSQEWIDEHAKAVAYDGIPDQTEVVYVDDLQNLLVPKQEEITEEQAWGVIHGKYGDETLQNNIDYVESQGYVVIEKPTIPPEVDELIRRGKGRGETLTNTVGLMKNAGWNRSPYADGAEWAVNNLSDFVIAWEHGYEVEEEQKYNVKFKVKSSFGTVGVFLYKQGDEVLAGDNFGAYYPEKDEFKLTEQEIKDFDPRYWAFAVEVSE